MDGFASAGGANAPNLTLGNGADALLSLATAAKCTEASSGRFASHNFGQDLRQKAYATGHAYPHLGHAPQAGLDPHPHMSGGSYYHNQHGQMSAEQYPHPSHSGDESGDTAYFNAGGSQGGQVGPPKERTLLELPQDRALTKEVAFELLAQGKYVSVVRTGTVCRFFFHFLPPLNSLCKTGSPFSVHTLPIVTGVR